MFIYIIKIHCSLHCFCVFFESNWFEHFRCMFGRKMETVLNWNVNICNFYSSVWTLMLLFQWYLLWRIFQCFCLSLDPYEAFAGIISKRKSFRFTRQNGVRYLTNICFPAVSSFISATMQQSRNRIKSTPIWHCYIWRKFLFVE